MNGIANRADSAPSPTTGVSYLATKCVDVRKHHQKSKWFMPWGPNQCEKKIQKFSEAMQQQIGANDIVFAIHVPHQTLEMSSWFQFLLVVLQFEIEFQIGNEISKFWYEGRETFVLGKLVHFIMGGEGIVITTIFICIAHSDLKV
ncbi:protein wntless homolog isoform X2 [Rhincodon typus]|uniref:protein wntless homolog isoform X2 n=1 Tax=Rhincodon typus TaxID=259920 RepID=UPI00202EFCF6|nr:protein wntless homolog isoform X2 [Rhincodon typus]